MASRAGPIPLADSSLPLFSCLSRDYFGNASSFDGAYDKRAAIRG
jgi:hypothetical protein